MQSRRTIGILLLLCIPTLCGAQGLTEPQYQQLKTDITVTHQTEFATAVTARNYQAIADAYNAVVTPTYWVWRTSLTPKEIYEKTSDTSATWSWTTYKGQTQQERDSWRDMMQPNLLNPSLKQTRDGWLAIFGGAGASQIQVNFLLAISRRAALRAEALFATGGDGSTATPSTMSYEGTITYKDVNHALTGAPLL